jgi:hypothetical protein
MPGLLATKYMFAEEQRVLLAPFQEILRIFNFDFVRHCGAPKEPECLSSYLFRIRSQYRGSSSVPKHTLPVRSAAISVVPEPKNRSKTIFPAAELLRMARMARAQGFIVGWS